NTGIDLDYQTLQNNIDGTLLSQLHQALPPGGTYQFNHIETVGTTNTYNATWSAQDIPSGYFPTVESGGNCSDSIFADGFDGPAAPCNGSAFIDITGTGLALSLSDDASANVSMPFSFNFYGYMSNEVTISNNGGAIFNSPWTPLDFLNVPLPAPNLPGPPVAYAFPLWDDFSDQSGQVYTGTRGVAPNRQFIVEWYNRVHYDGASNSDGATFEMILNENGTLQFEYADVEYTAINNLSNDPDDCTGGMCATIGLQKDTGVFTQFAAFQAAVTDNSGILWTPTNPQVFTSSDTVTVSVGAPQIVVNPSALSGTVTAGATSALPFAIENHGDRDLNWTLGEAAASNLHFPPPGTRFAMPLGDPAKASAGRAPLAASTKAGKSRSIRAPLINATVPTFAADIFQNNIETFDALAPQTVSVIAPINDGTGYVGGAFIDGDFSKLYAIAGNFGSNPDDLYTIDTTTGVPTLVGSAANAPAEGYAGLAYDSTSGNLYAASSTCGTSSHLWTLDPAAAAPTGVGEIIGAPCIIAIAVNAQGEMYGLDIVTDSLYAIDKTNGNAALIGSIGFNANFAQDMAFDLSTGVLYLAGFDFDALTDSIYTLDLQTGAANIIGPIGASLGEVDAMGIETVGGPCMQPQDLPWLSLSPVAGTTSPLGSTPVTASIDGTGSVAGDTLSGTVCVTSNDPVNRTVATPITVSVTGAPLFPPGLAKTFSPATVQAGVSSALAIELDNTMNGADISLTAPLTDTFPPGLVIAAIPNAASTCGGNITAVPGSDSVTFDAAGAVIPGLGFCFVTVDVAAASTGSYANDIPAGALQTTAGSNTFSADATLQVELVPPTITKDFNPLSVAVNTPSTLTITLGNANASADTLSTPLTDTFPTGVVVAATPNASTTCGGAITAVAGSDSVSLDAAGAQIPANGSCTIQVDVESAAAGTYSNDIPVAALQTNAGSNGAPADADLVVTP
ncbi:MAG TPA: hypothetical protein VGO25_07780, partial [Rhodanobacteraceae bacterium]|nr:hypothetical protein [Rhodanobacteraceae bacterium]